jgi:hypothetical protein
MPEKTAYARETAQGFHKKGKIMSFFNKPEGCEVIIDSATNTA